MCVHARVNSCKLNNPYLTSLKGVVCGSRAHLEDESIAQRTIIRTILMWVLKLNLFPKSALMVNEDEAVSFADKNDCTFLLFIRIGFHACVWIFAVKTVKDTQCGFKVPYFSVHLRPFLSFRVLNLIQIFQFFFSCWREKLQRFYSTHFTLRDGLLMSRCWRLVSWMHVFHHFS